MQRGVAAELDLRPLEVGDLAGAQAVAVGDEDQRRITIAMATIAGLAVELPDLGGRQVLAGAELAVGHSLRADCPKKVTRRLLARNYKHW